MYVGADDLIFDNAMPHVMDLDETNKTIYADTSGALFCKSCK